MECRWSPGEHPPAENARRSVTRSGAPGYGRRGGFTTRVGSDFAAWRGRSVVTGRHSTPFRPGEGKMSLRGANECSPARKPPHRKRRWRAFTPETPSKKPCGAMNTPVHDSNRPNEPPMRDGIPRPRLLSRGRRLATFPAPLEKKRRPPTPGPGPVSRAAASSHARFRPRFALCGLEKSRDKPTGR